MAVALGQQQKVGEANLAVVVQVPGCERAGLAVVLRERQEIAEVEWHAFYADVAEARTVNRLPGQGHVARAQQGCGATPVERKQFTDAIEAGGEVVESIFTGA